MEANLTVQVLGTNHKHTRLADRERLVPGADSVRELLRRSRESLAARECAVLCTCNRIEVYFVAPELEGDGRGRMRDLFGQVCDAPGETAKPVVYYHRGDQAVGHLLTVACGLDSMVLGEHEILGQVKTALGQALDNGYAGPELRRVFNSAIRAGKRARSETEISSGIFSVGQCAVRLAQQALGDLDGKRVLVFGAGRIAKTAAKHIAASCSGSITVFSRTPSRAHELAESVGGRAIQSDQLTEAFRASDIVLGCASAPHHVIGMDELRDAMAARPDRPMVVVDLGVPRNVDPAVASLPGIHLFNLDDLEAVVAENARARQAEIRQVEAIIEEELAPFEHAGGQELSAKLIVELRARAEELRQECLRQVAGRPSGGEDAEALDRATDLLVRKLLHQPIVALRRAACAPNGGEAALAAMVARIFGLNGEKRAAVTDQDCREPITAARADELREREGV